MGTDNRWNCWIDYYVERGDLENALKMKWKRLILL